MKKLFIWTLTLFILVGIAFAAPPNPEYYWGYVYIESELANNGTLLEVNTSSGEALDSVVLPFADIGSYFIQIDFDKPATPADEGADENESIIWYIDGIPAYFPTNDTAEKGKNNNNFTIIGIRNPNVAAVLTYSTDFILGNLFDLSILLNNTGNGTSNNDLNFRNTTQQLAVAKQSANSTNFNYTTDTCGLNTDLLSIDVKNFANSTVQTLSYNISYNVTGPDLFINMTLPSGTVTEGDSVPIYVEITNIGEENASGYNFSLTRNGGNLISTEYNNSLIPNITRNITYIWTATTGIHEFLASVNTSSIQCLMPNDEDRQNLTVQSSGGGGSGGGGSSRSSTSITGTATTGREPRIFEIYNYPKELDLITNDRVKYLVDEEWYIIDVENVHSSDGSLMFGAPINKFVVFEEGDEKQYDINHYKFYILLDQVDSEATFRFDLIEEVMLSANLDMQETFSSRENITFDITLDSNLDTKISEAIYIGDTKVWSNERIETEKGKISEIIGALPEGDYTLKILLESGKKTLDLEQEFTIAKLQMPLAIAKEKSNWVVLLLLSLFILALAAGYWAIKEERKKGMKGSDYEEEEKEEPKKPKKAKAETVPEEAIKQKEQPEPKIEDSKIKEEMQKPEKQETNQESKETEQENQNKKSFLSNIAAIFQRDKDKNFVTNVKKHDKVKLGGEEDSVFIPHEHLQYLKKWIEEYHNEKKITRQMKKMPQEVQTLGLEIYNSPKTLTKHDIDRLKRLFEQKFEYVNYNDLVLSGSLVARELKDELAEGIVEEKPKQPTKNKQKIKYFVLTRLDGISFVANNLRRGSILVVDYNPVKDEEGLNNALIKLKNITEANDGKIALTANNHLLVVPKDVDIFKNK